MQTLHILLRSIGLLFAVLLIVVGYVVAPVLFVNLDQVDAGDVVGKLLSYANLALLVTLLSLLILSATKWLQLVHRWLLLISVTIVLLTEYWISPLMQAIKAIYPDGLTQASPAWGEFAMWHGIYQLLFLSLIASLFVWSMINLNSLIYKEKMLYKKSL